MTVMPSSLRETAVRLLCLTFILALVLLVFAKDASFLFPQYESDSLVFYILGKGWSDGLTPYARLFDHKGPLLYVIQMCGQALCHGKIGLYIFEVLFAVFSFEMLYRCGIALGISRRLNHLSLCVALVLFVGYIGGGNTVEEWSMPFLVLPLWLCLRYFRGKSKSILWPSFITGACFGLVAMLRINDNCIICGLALGLVIYMLNRRRYAALGKCVLMFLAGAVSACAPFFIYFACVGRLDSMIYANYIFNVHYRANWSDAPSLSGYARIIVRLIPCLVLPFAAWSYDRGNRQGIAFTLIAISVITFFVFVSGAGYSHYYLMCLPLAALSVQCLSRASRLIKVAVAAIIAGPVIVYYGPSLLGNINDAVHAGEETSPQDFVTEVIPANQLDSVYTFGNPEVAGALVETGHFPLNKYFFGQIKFPKVDDFIARDIRDDFVSAAPLWVLSSHDVPSKQVVPLDSTSYAEIPRDSLPPTFPAGWHLYRRL